MKHTDIVIVLGLALAALAITDSARATVITTEITPSEIESTGGWTGSNGSPEAAPSLSWTRPTSASNAASSLAAYAEWDGFAVSSATNAPTGNSYFSSNLTSIPRAGDSSSSTSGSFIIANGTANNAYYSNASTGDIYSFSGVIKPQITMPTYNVAGNHLNVLVQVEQDGQQIDTSQLTVNGILASTLPNYGVTETYTDGGTQSGFGTAYTNDYAWTFTLPDDPSSLELDFGWGVTSSALTSAVIDTQSSSSPVPEPVSVGLMIVPAFMLLGRRRSVA